MAHSFDLELLFLYVDKYFLLNTECTQEDGDKLKEL
jgi:hypothetical protein